MTTAARQVIEARGDRKRGMTGTDGPAAVASTGPDAAEVYALGSNPDESARLQRQSDELRPEGAALLERLALLPGQSAIDLGCGPRGIIDLLSAAVSPGGRVVGLDANPEHVAMADDYARQSGLANVEVVAADARHTGLPSDSFDLVHARTLLVTIPEPAAVVREMVRLAKPGGWVASQEPDVEHRLCYPPLPAWDRLGEIFQASFGRAGADLFIGRRLTELFRAAGLAEIGVTAHASAYPAGHSRRTILPDLARSLHATILELGLANERELSDLDRAVREHLADPRTVAIGHLLFVAWGRKPAGPLQDPG
jgi:SAM-dependent methyltransferase